MPNFWQFFIDFWKKWLIFHNFSEIFSKVESSNLVTSQNPTEFDAKIDRLCLMPNVAQITSMFRATFLSILPNKLIFDLWPQPKKVDLVENLDLV